MLSQFLGTSAELWQFGHRSHLDVNFDLGLHPQFVFPNSVNSHGVFASLYEHSAALWDRDLWSGPLRDSDMMAPKTAWSGTRSCSTCQDGSQDDQVFSPSKLWGHSVVVHGCQVPVSQAWRYETTCRVGEASHPGPNLAIHCVNPTGLGGKEDLVYDLEPGITCISETHLAAPGMASSCGALRSRAHLEHRRLRVLPGACLPLRARSQFTGTWSGVMQLSDVPCHRLQMQWPQNEFDAGRVQTAVFYVCGIPIQGTVVYGWSPGPTWPRARQATRQLLQHLTLECVQGAQGMRFITGDFNGDDSSFPEWNAWQSAGWKEIQQLHLDFHQEGPFPTCKGRTQPDRLWVSPELAMHFQRCQVRDLFADHAALTGHFDIPMSAACYNWWPMPAKVPWGSVNLEAWQQLTVTYPKFDPAQQSSTDYLSDLGKSYESLLGSYSHQDGMVGLPSACKGRAQIFEPVSRDQQQPVSRPSRRGEEVARSDFMNRSVQRWFKQLRRFQSLLHNLRRASIEPSAVTYRLETWTSIKTARGFGVPFAVWWAARPHRLYGCPHELPRDIPVLPLAELLFEDFRQNFRAFESWHLRHRRATLTAIMREDTRKAFQSVSEIALACPDRFVETTHTLITDVDDQSPLLAIDRPLPLCSTATWLLEDEPVRARQIDEFQLELLSTVAAQPGQEITQQRQVVSVDAMLASLNQFWHPRWKKLASIPEGHWDRLCDFVEGYMPKQNFTLPNMSVPVWKQVNRRYSKHAARGADGFDHMDLLHLPDSFHEGILSMLSRIETGTPWPLQLLLGFCQALPKRPDACSVADHRPIVVFSVLYRSWSTMRARSILHQLAEFVPGGLVGFIPGREAGDVWHYIQAMVELALQSGSRLTGVVSDVKKAFESIPRTAFFRVASKLGLPAPLLTAWSSFLDTMQRCFILHHHMGAPMDSDWGMPEGCALSVVAMIVVDWIWDTYHHTFSAGSVPVSYADNFEILASSVGSLMRGFVSLETYMDTWNMELDAKKTYFWSTVATDRTALRAAGKPICLEASDLGGAMTYCKRTGMGAQKVRVESLQPMWARLRRSAAPSALKCLILRQAFWSRAFHAIGITLFPFRHVGQLRTSAARALGFGRAGAHPGLRLALLCGNMQCDPGFFQVVRVFVDFRRFADAQPQLVTWWSDFMQRFDGKLFSGPFSKILEITSQLGWHVNEPPWISDHDGLMFDLLQISSTALMALLQDAWTQRLASEVVHRLEFNTLHGLHWPPSRHESRLSALDTSLVNSLREGVFLSSLSQSKFDLTKGDTCVFCGSLDTIEHRCRFCPAFDTTRADHRWAIQHWDEWPTALTCHLLPSRVPGAAQRKRELHGLADWQTLVCPRLQPLDDWMDFFTDGSCRWPTVPSLALASWAVVCASTGEVCVSSPLAGIQQDVNRAELTAVVWVIHWAWQTGARVALWCDSAYVGAGVDCLLNSPGSLDMDSNEDLWQTLRDLVPLLGPAHLSIQHINSHRLHDPEADALQHWISTWNEVADNAAEAAHDQRPAILQCVCDRHHDAWMASEKAVDAFRALHLAIAKARADRLPELTEEVADEEDLTLDALPVAQRGWQEADDWLDAVPLHWHHRWQQSDRCGAFSFAVAQNLLHLFSSERDQAEGAVSLAWIEMAVWLHVLNFDHPFLNSNNIWVPGNQLGPAHGGQLTLAARVRFLKTFFKCLDTEFEVGVDFVCNLNLSRFSVHPPQSGMICYISRASQRRVDLELAKFTAQRPIRCANDLARPL